MELVSALKDIFIYLEQDTFVFRGVVTYAKARSSEALLSRLMYVYVCFELLLYFPEDFVSTIPYVFVSLELLKLSLMVTV